MTPATPTASEQIAVLRGEVQELQRAVYIVAGQQLNQSGVKPSLVSVIERYAPAQPQTRPQAGFTQREVVSP